MRSHAHALLRQQYAKEGGMEKQKRTTSTRVDSSVHSCILQPRSLFVCLLPNFTRLLLSLKLSTKGMSADLFAAKE